MGSPKESMSTELLVLGSVTIFHHVPHGVEQTVATDSVRLLMLREPKSGEKTPPFG